MNRKTLILSVLAVAVTVFAVAAWYVSRPATSDSSATTQVAAPLVRPWSPILGPAKAPVTLVEFFDPACETCRAMYPIVKDIMAEHGKAVRVVIRYTPFHGEVSEEAIRVLEAARVRVYMNPFWKRFCASNLNGHLMVVSVPTLSCRSRKQPVSTRKLQRNRFVRPRLTQSCRMIVLMDAHMAFAPRQPSLSMASRFPGLG